MQSRSHHRAVPDFYFSATRGVSHREEHAIREHASRGFKVNGSIPKGNRSDPVWKENEDATGGKERTRGAREYGMYSMLNRGLDKFGGKREFSFECN